MARLNTAAAFVKHKMPLGQGGTLTDQEAFDVAAYFTTQPRPDFAAAAKDWPKGDKLASSDILEEYTYTDIKFNVGLTDKDFDSRNKSYNF